MLRLRIPFPVFVLLIIILFISCTQHKAVTLQETAEESDFLLAKDTISTHGPQSITRNILQDSKGNYWFATWQGVICYNGKLFTNITLQKGLKHFHVMSILEDKHGNLWFGMIKGGVYRYDPDTTSDKAFTYFTTKDGLADNSVMCMLEDKAGNIWLGTTNGVSCYNSSTASFASFTTKDGLIHHAVYSIMQDRTGKIWFGTQGGISCYDPSAVQPVFTNFPNEKGLPFIGVRSIVQDKSGNTWIGSQSGLNRYDGKSIATITTNFTASILEDKAGNLWLSESGIANGRMTLSRYNTGEASEKSFMRITNEPQVFGIAGDEAGNIWFGTVNGACRYDGKSIIRFSGN